MKQFTISEKKKADVLVIGGGGAGIYAAIEAARAGVSVLLVSKGKVGNSGNTIMIGGSYSMDGYTAKHTYGFADSDDSVTQDYLFEQIVKQSFYLSEQDVAQQYVEDSPACVYEMHEWAEQAGARQMFTMPAGWMLSGRAMGRGLLHGLQQVSNVTVVEDVMVVDLLKNDDCVVGAIGLDVYSGAILQFEAKAVVIATGGYQPFTIKSVNSDMTGDGLAIAYRAGAELADMEFLLPCVTALEPEALKGSLMPFIVEAMEGLTLDSVDKNGHRIVIPEEMRKVAEGSELEKLIMTYYWSEAVAENRSLPDDSFYYDFNCMREEAIRDAFDHHIETMAMFYRRGFYHGDSITEFRDKMLANGKRIRVASIFEYSMGGILITKNMETTVPGLFAAGEAGSGVFGACRVADATTEMLVQGRQAGRTAAAYAKHTGFSDARPSAAANILAELAKPLHCTGGMTGVQFIRNIESAADCGFGICREQRAMEQSIAMLEQLLDEQEKLSVANASMRYNYDFIRAIQGKNLLICTMAGIRAACMRKESRGFHMRHDYRLVDNDAWTKRILARMGSDAMALSTRVPKVVRFPFPTGVDASIPIYIKQHDLNFKNADFSRGKETVQS